LTLEIAQLLSCAMKLAEYLDLPDKTQKGLADKIGASQGLVFQWLDGRTKITPDKAILVEVATERMVTCEELLPELSWERDRRGNVVAYRVPVVVQKPASRAA